MRKTVALMSMMALAIQAQDHAMANAYGTQRNALLSPGVAPIPKRTLNQRQRRKRARWS